mgnify:CR=1 FL=1
MKGIRRAGFKVLALLLAVTLLVLANAAYLQASEGDQGLERVVVNEYGLDSEGRMVAYFGSPVVDGEVDEIWSQAVPVTPKYISNGVQASAKFRALWDDNALYILAEIKDDQLSDQSANTYEQDSFEVFLDENNNKSSEYGVDDVHFRVNYKNARTADDGDIERFYTRTKVVEDGYIVEARVALQSAPVNGKVLGIELQVNEAKGAQRLGTINVFDATGTAWQDTSKFGEIILLGRPDNAVMGLNPYTLLTLIDIYKELDVSRYANFEIVADAIKAAEAFLDGEIETQQQIDDQVAALRDAVSKLEPAEWLANEKEFKALPNQYRWPNEQQGTIETVVYQATNRRGGTDTKKLHVYLPYGYYDEGNDRKYNVLYLMHGGGENEDLLFGGPGQNRELKRIIDNMIAFGDIEPLIVVTPTFYRGMDDAGEFHKELVNDVIPVVETKYRTYLTTGDLEDMKATRNHRAFGGFSMGALSTWYTYIFALDYVKYFMPLSGDCWIIPTSAGARRAMLTAEYLERVAKNGGYEPTDYYLLCATGDADIAYGNMVPQIEALKQLSDSFIYSGDVSKGNFYFMVAKGGTHHWNWVNQYIYNILPDLFRD